MGKINKYTSVSLYNMYTSVRLHSKDFFFWVFYKLAAGSGWHLQFISKFVPGGKFQKVYNVSFCLLVHVIIEVF